MSVVQQRVGELSAVRYGTARRRRIPIEGNRVAHMTRLLIDYGKTFF